MRILKYFRPVLVVRPSIANFFTSLAQTAHLQGIEHFRHFRDGEVVSRGEHAERWKRDGGGDDDDDRGNEDLIGPWTEMRPSSESALGPV